MKLYRIVRLGREEKISYFVGTTFDWNETFSYDENKARIFVNLITVKKEIAYFRKTKVYRPKLGITPLYIQEIQISVSNQFPSEEIPSIIKNNNEAI